MCEIVSTLIKKEKRGGWQGWQAVLHEAQSFYLILTAALHGTGRRNENPFQYELFQGERKKMVITRLFIMIILRLI